MHLVAKQVKGHEYFYLVEKARRDGRVVTARTVYIGDRQKLAEEGVVVVVVTVDIQTGKVLVGPEIITRGWVYIRVLR